MFFKAGTVLGVAMLAAVLVQTAVGARATSAPAQLLANGGFEQSLTGWSGWNARLARVTPGAAGKYAVRVTSTSSQFALSASPKQVASTDAGATYTASAKVRTSMSGGRTICLRMREWDGATVSGSNQICAASGSSWRTLGPVSYTASGGRALDVYLYVSNGRKADTFFGDALSLTETGAPQPEPQPQPQVEAAGCDAVAAPGTGIASFLSSLSPGQTGCLHGGTYDGEVDIRSGGAPGSPIKLTSYPGERAKIVGRVVVFESASDIVFSSLDFDGNGGGNTLPSPTVDGDRITFDSNDVTNDHTAICFDLGSDMGYGTATDALIENNRIHDCGKLPAQNHDHGIYVESTRNAHIVGNTIYRNADRGIQLYPDAQGTVVERNTIVGNGSGIIISGDLGFASSDSTIRDNVIANSVLRYDVESFWAPGNAVGTNNRVTHNCIWGGKEGTTDGGAGYTISGTIHADPGFVSPSTGDYRLRTGSACAGLGA